MVRWKVLSLHKVRLPHDDDEPKIGLNNLMKWAGHVDRMN